MQKDVICRNSQFQSGICGSLVIFFNVKYLNQILNCFRLCSQKAVKMQYYDSKSQLDAVSDIDSHSAFEMRPWPSHYSSQLSITPSYKSYLSAYTPSQASFYTLPVMQETPNEMRRPESNRGFAFFSLLFNPIFGIVAVLLAGKLLISLPFIIYNKL